MSRDGLVLVWDMDSTLVGNYVDPEGPEPIKFNERAVAILRLAVEARKRGKVTAIFLLTNNSDEKFIKAVKFLLSQKVDSPKVFDYTMQRYHPARPLSADPPKRLQDVEYMLKQIKLPTDNLSQRLYFFDDRPDHLIRNEIPEDHYIQITPPYEPNVKDQTNFKPINTAIRAFGGRRTRNRRRRASRTRKYFRRY
jgi:hypothetical protein